METRFENLAMLYQGAFTAAVRIQARRQQIGSAMAFRQRMKDVLAEIGREAVRRNYANVHISEADFAFVAFLDEVILSSSDPSRDDWAKRPLQEDLFGLSTAGEQFFKHLDSLLAKPDTNEWIDVLEIYYLCLLLGFQGLYISAGRAELQMYAERIRQRIERLRRVHADLSPSGLLPSENIVSLRINPSPNRLRIAATVTAAFALLCFLGFGTDLLAMAASVNALLLRSVTP